MLIKNLGFYLTPNMLMASYCYILEKKRSRNLITKAKLIVEGHAIFGCARLFVVQHVQGLRIFTLYYYLVCNEKPHP